MSSITSKVLIMFVMTGCNFEAQSVGMAAGWSNE